MGSLLEGVPREDTDRVAAVGRHPGDRFVFVYARPTISEWRGISRVAQDVLPAMQKKVYAFAESVVYGEDIPTAFLWLFQGPKTTCSDQDTASLATLMQEDAGGHQLCSNWAEGGRRCRDLEG